MRNENGQFTESLETTRERKATIDAHATSLQQTMNEITHERRMAEVEAGYNQSTAAIRGERAAKQLPSYKEARAELEKIYADTYGCQPAIVAGKRVGKAFAVPFEKLAGEYAAKHGVPLRDAYREVLKTAEGRRAYDELTRTADGTAAMPEVEAGTPVSKALAGNRAAIVRQKIDDGARATQIAGGCTYGPGKSGELAFGTPVMSIDDARAKFLATSDGKALTSQLATLEAEAS